MFARKLSAPAVFGCIGLIALTGCFSLPWTRTGNQGGGTIVTAAGKLLGDTVNELNPDEIQMLADTAMQFANVDIPEVTDEQAQAVVTFIHDNNITTIASLEEVVQRGEEDPESVVISDEVRAVLEAIARNVEQYQGLEDVDAGQSAV